MLTTNEIISLDKKYILPTYAPFDVAFARGDGCKLYDVEGKEYLDFLSGIAVCALGHNNRKINNALLKQAKSAMIISNYYYSEPKARLAELLVKGTHFGKVFFNNSGAEANETAFKIAKKYFNANGGKKYKIITCSNSFHGRTIAAVTATGQEKYYMPFSPMPDWFEYIPFNDVDALKKALADPAVGAFMVECIQGEGGVVPATNEFLQAARKLTKRNGQLLIIDEIQTGIMRTGKMFAYQNYGIKPDIITLAKGLGGGIPIAACVVTDAVASVMAVGDHGTTFGGNPLSCQVGYTVVKELKKASMVKHIQEVSEYLYEKLSAFLKCPQVKELRGKGLMLGLELSADIKVKDVVLSLLEKGLVVSGAGNNTLRFVPALIISKEEIDQMVDILKSVLII